MSISYCQLKANAALKNNSLHSLLVFHPGVLEKYLFFLKSKQRLFAAPVTLPPSLHHTHTHTHTHGPLSVTAADLNEKTDSS